MPYLVVGDMDCIAIALLALMVQSEAPQEPLEGKIAVAYVAVNRAVQVSLDASPTERNAALVRVLQQPRQFKINPYAIISESSWFAAQTAYYQRRPDPTHGADHFYNPEVKPWPSWYDERYATVRIGRHTFLRLGGF